jgi:transposase
VGSPDRNRLKEKLWAQGRLVIALDGLQPDVGHEVLWVVRRKKPSPVMETIAPGMEMILAEWRDRTTAKQRITGTRVHRQLVEEGYEVGVTTVRDYLREERRKRAEVFVPLVHHPGEEGGHRRKVWTFVMRLMYPGRDFVRLNDRCDQLSFLDAHVKAYRYLFLQRIVYDNLSAAVNKIVGSGSSPNVFGELDDLLLPQGDPFPS